MTKEEKNLSIKRNNVKQKGTIIMKADNWISTLSLDQLEVNIKDECVKHQSSECVT